MLDYIHVSRFWDQCLSMGVLASLQVVFGDYLANNFPPHQVDPYTDTQLGYAYQSAANNDMKVFISFDFNW